MPATLVVGYTTALKILRNPEQFPADPPDLQASATECPVAGALGFRPNPLRTSESDHSRYRRAHVDVLAMVDQHAVQAMVEPIAVPLINAFCGRGEADLRAQFAVPIAIEMVNRLLGVPAADAARLAAARGGADVSAAGDEMVGAVLADVVAQKKVAPGRDMISGLIGHHAELSDEELVAQIALIYAMGIDPTVSLILNTLRLMLTDERFAGHMLGGALSTCDALDEVLFTDPPVANSCVTYPRVPQLVNGVWLPANQPVVISLTACNRDPAIRRGPALAGERVGNRSHLAWGAGQHSCPSEAQGMARLIAMGAIDQLMDAMPDMRLAVPAEALTWHSESFQRALTSLPVTFPPMAPLPVQL
ncbi:cytochrome P450 [Nocardia rhamnosiphila]